MGGLAAGTEAALHVSVHRKPVHMLDAWRQPWAGSGGEWAANTQKEAEGWLHTGGGWRPIVAACLMAAFPAEHVPAREAGRGGSFFWPAPSAAGQPWGTATARHRGRQRGPPPQRWQSQSRRRRWAGGGADEGRLAAACRGRAPPLVLKQSAGALLLLITWWEPEQAHEPQISKQ